MEWISVKDRLPEIPEGRFGISVLTAEFDHIYDEICPGKGYSVQEGDYMVVTDVDRKKWKWPDDIKADFMARYSGSGETIFGPTANKVTHWMPMPAAPERNE